MSAPIQPHVRWAQRKAFLFIKIDVPGSKPQNSKFNITEKTLDFEAEVEGKKYSVHLDFFKEINPQVNIIKIRFFFFDSSFFLRKLKQFMNLVTLNFVSSRKKRMKVIGLD